MPSWGCLRPRLLRMLRRFIRYDLGLASQGWRPTF